MQACVAQSEIYCTSRKIITSMTSIIILLLDFLQWADTIDSMEIKTKFLLDSGDPDEYREIATLAEEKNSELWGATTNPSLIAKKLAGKKMTPEEAFKLQKEIVLEIVEIVPGAVSAEVYADEQTTAESMIEQGKGIATWHDRVVVKLPTTVEGFKARTALRKANILTNNTLVFSQEQIFAICLHEQLVRAEGAEKGRWPAFISPFIGRLDDKGEKGIELVQNGMTMKRVYNFDLWMLAASIRTIEHMKHSIALESELITAPAKVYKEWFALSEEEQEKPDFSYGEGLTNIADWVPSNDLLQIQSLEEFMKAITSGDLNIQHPLTEAGISKFAADWKAILSA